MEFTIKNLFSLITEEGYGQFRIYDIAEGEEVFRGTYAELCEDDEFNKFIYYTIESFDIADDRRIQLCINIDTSSGIEEWDE